MADAKEIREAEQFAKDAMCRDLKRDYEQRNIRRTSEQIEREVQVVQERVAREGTHTIYRGK